MKFSCITGSMGNRCDRFMSCGYKEDLTGDEKVKGLVDTGVLGAVELCYDLDGCESDVETVNARLQKFGTICSVVNAPVSDQKQFKFGSLTNNNPEIRREAIDYCKRTIDFGSGCPLWHGQHLDGSGRV